MPWNAEEFNEELRNVTARFNRKAAEALCEKLVEYLWSADDDYPKEEACATLQLLRNKRMFALMRRVGDAFLQTGSTSLKLRRLYAQALIDSGELTAAFSALNELVTLTVSDAFENAEARGLVGRAHKQLYVNTAGRKTTQRQEHLRRAVIAYHEVYTSAPAERLWHGINAVALLDRAARDGVALEGFPEPRALAATILAAIKAKGSKANMWDFGTAVEACVALKDAPSAASWLVRYASTGLGADAFELASTLRQLTEVWQLDMQSEMGQWILPPLRSQLLEREGGRVDLSREDLQMSESSPNAFEYEKVLGADSYKSLRWWQLGLQRCRLVARLGRDASRGYGTGFLLRGSDLSSRFGDGLVLLTNSHVVSHDPDVRKRHGALPPEEVIVSFEAHGENEYEIAEMLWSSPPESLDATVLRLANTQELASTLEGQVAAIAKRLPVVDESARVYVIGHPGGGALSYSLEDNILLGHESPRIHYRAPTDGGSSGSPVFNAKWDLIGLHHAGSEAMPRLNGQSGTYPANEAIWLRSIIGAISE